MRSLGLLLRTPQAAHTQLSISIADWGRSSEDENEWDARLACEALCEALQEVGEKLVGLDLPCNSIGEVMHAARVFLPHIRSLVLRIDQRTSVEALADSVSDSEGEEKGRREREFSSSQLTSLVLRAQPGAPPVCIFDLDAQHPLQLQHYPRLQHLELIGPIVREEDECPFLLPADTKVCPKGKKESGLRWPKLDVCGREGSR